MWMMIPGYSYESAKDFSLLHDINMRSSEEGSDADFRSLLGKANIVPPANEHEALLMLQGMKAFLVKMADGLALLLWVICWQPICGKNTHGRFTG